MIFTNIENGYKYKTIHTRTNNNTYKFRYRMINLKEMNWVQLSRSQTKEIAKDGFLHHEQVDLIKSLKRSLHLDYSNIYPVFCKPNQTKYVTYTLKHYTVSHLQHHRNS